MTVASDTSVSAGATSFSLPHDFKDVYDLRVISTGRQRTLTGIPRRLYDRVVQEQTGISGELAGYDLFQQGAYGLMTITPPPAAADTLSLKYYRRMWVPCTVNATVVASGGADTSTASASGQGGFVGITNGSPCFITGQGWTVSSSPATAILSSPTTMQISGALYASAASGSASATFGGDTCALDIPEDFENGILALAARDFLSNLGAPTGRLSTYIQVAEDEFQEARAANERYEDQDLAFEVGTPTYYYARIR